MRRNRRKGRRCQMLPLLGCTSLRSDICGGPLLLMFARLGRESTRKPAHEQGVNRYSGLGVEPKREPYRSVQKLARVAAVAANISAQLLIAIAAIGFMDLQGRSVKVLE